MGEQMGLQGLAIPEEFGGSGYSFVELGVVLEEMGRALLCAPYFSTVVLAANTLLQSGDDAAKKDFLPGIAAGETIATLAFTEPSGKWDESGITMEATQDGDGWTLNGTKMFVLDGHTADLIIVAARTGGGVSLFTVVGDAAGLTRTALSTMDQTRKQAKLEFADTPARLHRHRGPGLGRAVHGARPGRGRPGRRGGRRGQKVLEMAVEYAKVRVQFGRPIGSFQAIKHKCADMLLEVESAKSAAYYGMWCAAEMNDELPVGGLAGQGLLLRGLLPRRGREHPDPRRHRLHLGAPGAPVLQAGQELRAAVRRPHLPPRAAGPAHRHLSASALARPQVLRHLVPRLAAGATCWRTTSPPMAWACPASTSIRAPIGSASGGRPISAPTIATWRPT